jgi:hypothetical protein
MRRTQLYLEDDLWEALHLKARTSGESISELVRRAARDRYMGGSETREEAMRGVIGLWAKRTGLPATEGMIRKIRKGARIVRLAR